MTPVCALMPLLFAAIGTAFILAVQLVLQLFSGEDQKFHSR
jgi:hypothetical protein